MKHGILMEDEPKKIKQIFGAETTRIRDFAYNLSNKGLEIGVIGPKEKKKIRLRELIVYRNKRGNKPFVFCSF